MTKRTKTAALTVACLCAATAFAAPAWHNGAEAKSYANQDPTEYLEVTLTDMGYTPEGGYTIDYTYNKDLEVNGLEYTFTIQDEQCYALMTSETDSVGNVYYDIMEMFFNSPSPFASAQGKKVYLDMFTYIDYTDGAYYDITSNQELTDGQLDKINSIGFGANDDYENYNTVFEEISYASRNTDSYTFQYGLPTYSVSSYRNACANISGGIVLGYYDIFCPNLIPNYSTIYTSNNRTRYHLQSEEISAVIDQLYYDMKTNVSGGTTVTNFKAGMTDYVKRQGYNISFASVKSGSSFSYDSYKTQIKNAKPVALFLMSFNINDGVLPYDGADHIDTTYYSVNHAMVGCGYLEIDYYNASGANFRSDKYLKISTAMDNATSGYMRINDKENVYDALAITIA
ncbi:MAG: hypothetical protein K2L54_00075 [Clostridiales bacterium]|nr:hypothetical protein [Clostridiales bacterium]